MHGFNLHPAHRTLDLKPNAQSLTMLHFDAHRLCFAFAGTLLFHDLSLAIGPGLTLVRGGDGCGKTSLLRLIAGQLEPQAGTVRHRASPVWYEDPADPAFDPMPAQVWLRTRLETHPGGEAALGTATQAALTDSFGLAEHLHKPLYMLSTGSRRKPALVGAAACGAPMVLLDTPFAALDTPSCRAVTALLAHVASQRQCAWVVADSENLRGIAAEQLTGTIDLGDEPGVPIAVKVAQAGSRA